MLDITVILKSMSITSIGIFFPDEAIRNNGPVCVLPIVFRLVAIGLSAT